MGNKDDKLNIYEVNSLLFQIISYMSETERRKLQTLLMANLSEASDGKDLSSLVTSISEAKRCELLEKLTNWYHSKNSELRGYPRKPLIISVELSKNGFTFMFLTQNISQSGVFIQTDFSFKINQQVTMILSPPEIEKDLTVGGKIVRLDSKGIGVKFDELLTDL